VRRTLRPTGQDKALAHLGDISASAPGTSSAIDAWTMIQRKLEVAGVIATGTGAPVFANETALFYFDTAADRFYVRETSAYTAVAIGSTESEIIGHDASTSANPPSAPTASSPWIYIRTAQNRVFLKERSGSPGSYTYAWTGPIFEGNSRTEVVYHTAAAPPALSTSWNWQTNEVNITGGGWSFNPPNAKWAIILTLPRNSNNPIVSPRFRVGDPSPADITFTPKDGTGNLAASVNNLQEVIDYLNTATLGGGGGGTDDQTAAEVPTTTSSFNNNLSSADTNVQLALNTIDNIAFPELQSQRFPRISGAITTSGIDQAFTVIPGLINERTNYDEGLFIEAVVDVRMQASVTLGDSATFIFEVLDSADVATGIQSEQFTLQEAAANVDRSVRLAGVLPATFTAGKLRTRLVRQSGTPPLSGVEGIKLQIRSDVQADEVIVNQSDLGNNLTGDADNLEEIISEVDEMPIQPADYEDVPWPSGANAIDDNDTEVRRVVTFHRNLTNANNRAGISYIARITYDAVIEAGSGGALSQMSFTHKTYAGSPALTEIQTATETTGRGAQTKTYDVTIPSGTTAFAVGFTNPDNGRNGRLEITNYQVSFLQGIDASGFNGNLATSDNSAQKVAQKVDDLTAAALGVGINASGFDGNLTTDDDTVQEVAQAFDDYVPTATQATVNSNQFSDPANFIGGLREDTGVSGIPVTPANVQQSLVKADYLLQDAFNPFQSTQLLDRSVGGSFSSSFTLNNTTPIYSNPVIIPAEVRALGSAVAVRIRVRISALDTGFTGDLRLVDPDNRATVFYGDAEVVNTTAYSASTPNNYVTFQRTIAAASVPDTFEVRFQRTDAGTGATTFVEGFADVVDVAGGAMGGAGGQASSYSTTIIWLAGASITDRLTTRSETTNYTLMAGHRFDQYDQLVFVFDAGAGSTQPLMPCWVDANLFQAFGAAGTLWIQANYWLMISRQSPTTFRYRWGTPNNGLRRIIGIRTN